MQDKLHDLFKLAIWDEHISHSLYLATAGRTKDRETKHLLLGLAADEKKHCMELQEMHEVLCCQEEIEVTKIGYPSPIESHFLAKKDGPDLKAFLTYAMEKENTALNYYLNMAEHLDSDPKASATLLHFSAMESDHYQLLKKELKNLGDSGK